MMKNILIIVPSLGGGGAERTATLLANQLVETGKYHVHMCILSSLPVNFSLNKNINIFRVDEHLKWLSSMDKNIKRTNYISQQAEQLKIDLIIGYTIIGGILSCLVKLKTGIDNIVCERQDPKQFSKISRTTRDLFYRKATAAVFQTNDAQSYFSDIVKDSVVIPNFIDANKMPDIIPFKDRENRIVNVGRLEPAKDQSLLIKTFDEIHTIFPDYIVEIYGEGSEYKNLSEQIKASNLSDKVFLRGYSSTVFEDIKSAKIFVLTSKYEGYPNALLEAMAMGLVVISADCSSGGPRAMINNNENGLLFPVGDKSMLKRKLIECLEDPLLMEKFSNNAQSIRISNGIEAVFNRWISFIDKILDKKNMSS